MKPDDPAGEASAPELMVEALNDWFTKHGKPPIA
jgi:hypothetical protein